MGNLTITVDDEVLLLVYLFDADAPKKQALARRLRKFDGLGIVDPFREG